MANRTIVIATETEPVVVVEDGGGKVTGLFGAFFLSIAHAWAIVSSPFAG